jgi:branched-chain amino acid aminotransferase
MTIQLKLIVAVSFFFCQVPPPGKGSLYIRPLLMGNGAILGLAPAPEYMFLVYSAPVGTYFKVCIYFPTSGYVPKNQRKYFRTIVNFAVFLQEGMVPINLLIEDEFHRASPGGTGAVKTITNYAPVSIVIFIRPPN